MFFNLYLQLLLSSIFDLMTYFNNDIQRIIYKCKTSSPQFIHFLSLKFRGNLVDCP